MGWLRRLQRFVFPPQCVFTGERLTHFTQIENLSDEAFQSFSLLNSPCPICAEYSLDGGECGACLSERPAFDHSQVAFAYKDDLRDLIHRFKFQNEHYCVQVLADLMMTKLDPRGIEALLPVPLHLSRLQERGFNQSLELAKIISNKTGIPVIDTALIRTRPTPSQTTLNKAQRLQNLKGAFKVIAEPLKGLEKVAIIDDVMTTGSTMQCLAKIIKQQTNISWIEAWAIAKPPLS